MHPSTSKPHPLLPSHPTTCGRSNWVIGFIGGTLQWVWEATKNARNLPFWAHLPTLHLLTPKATSYVPDHINHSIGCLGGMVGHYTHMVGPWSTAWGRTVMAQISKFLDCGRSAIPDKSDGLTNLFGVPVTSFHSIRHILMYDCHGYPIGLVLGTTESQAIPGNT